jgi:predicted nucleic acid-binding protein
MIVLDSNTFTYLINAIHSENENELLAQEYLALIRIFFYTGKAYHLLPKVEEEYQNIPEEKKRKLHERFRDIHFIELKLPPDEREIISRTKELFKHHSKTTDCRIVAEAEFYGADILLTIDSDLLKRLKNKSNGLEIAKPSEYWLSLKIPQGTEPVITPYHSNPLLHKSNVWRW